MILISQKAYLNDLTRHLHGLKWISKQICIIILLEMEHTTPIEERNCLLTCVSKPYVLTTVNDMYHALTLCQTYTSHIARVEQLEKAECENLN